MSATCAPEARAPAFPLPLRCLNFSPAHHAGQLLGFADIRLPGGLEMRELRISLRGLGLAVTFPVRAVIERGEIARFPNGDPRVLRPVTIPDPDDAAAFTHAVLAAVRAAFPDALPQDHPIPETQHSASLAPATMEN